MTSLGFDSFELVKGYGFLEGIYVDCLDNLELKFELLRRFVNSFILKLNMVIMMYGHLLIAIYANSRNEMKMALWDRIICA